MTLNGSFNSVWSDLETRQLEVPDCLSISARIEKIFVKHKIGIKVEKIKLKLDFHFG